VSVAPLEPLPGDPDTVLALAARLRAQAARVGSVAGLLQALVAGGDATWQSPAGAAFTSTAAAVVPPLRRIETRYAVAASVLVGLADELRGCQVSVARAVSQRDDAYPRFVAVAEAMSLAEQSSDESRRAEAVVLRQLMVEQGQRVAVAEAEHARAIERWRAADQRAAVVLGRLVQDGLADDALYDALTTASRLSGGTGEVSGALELVPPLRAAAAPVSLLAAGVQIGSDITVRSAYGDGDWATIALEGAAAVAGPVATGLRATASAGSAVPGGATSVVRVGDRHTPSSAWRGALVHAGVNPPPVWRERLAEGLREGWAEAVGSAGTTAARAGRAPKVSGVVPVPAAGRARADWLRNHARDVALAHATAYARSKWLDDWARATSAGPVSQALHVSGSAVAQGGRAADRASDARESDARHDGR
jgi:hypothetical protein